MSRVAEYEARINDTRTGRCRFKPHGVMAVIGPFNFPAHLPNGHFVPALLMGDTVVVKPSDKTPAVGQLMAELMHEAGAPAGVFNVIQGAADVASTLVNHDDIDGVLFTGSWPVGRRIMEANLDRPGRMLALETRAIANMGAYPDPKSLERWYARDADGIYATTLLHIVDIQ